jgi:hypothetical protein
MQKLKLELNAAVVKKFTDLHINLKVPFEVILSNYTTRIKSDLYDLHFMKNAQSNRVFVAYAMLKKDVEGKKVDDINPGFLKYYQTVFNFLNLYADKIYNIDIKSAYASILFNDGFISEPTYRYIMGLPKVDRLAAVGMLAGRKNIFSFDSTGKISGSIETVLPTSNFFFYAVKQTFEIMDRLKNEIGDDFIFSWVDGIYFSKPCSGIVIQDILKNEFKLNCSFDELTDFEVKERKAYYLLTYLKEGQKKVFNLPKQDSTIRNDVYNYLLTKKFNQKCS